MDAKEPEEYFDREVRWNDALAPDASEAVPDLLEEDDYRTPTPPDVYALRYCDEETVQGVLARLWDSDDGADQ